MKRFSCRSVLCFCLLTSPFFSAAQVSIGKFLASASEDYEVKTFDAQTSYLDTKPYRLSPLRELEYRHTNYELLDVHNRMGIRLSPANPWELRANKQYHLDYRGTLQLERELAFKEALRTRYEAVTKYMYYQELKNLTVAGANVLRDQLAILERQSGSSIFDAREFAKLQIEELSYDIEIQEIDAELASHIHALESILPQIHDQPLTWMPAELIPVAEIRSIVDSMVTASVRSTLLAYEQQRIRTAQSQYKLEKHDWNIGFIQGTYDQWRNEKGEVPLILSFGVAIPITNTNKPEMTRRRLQVIEAEYDLQESKSESERDKLILQDRLISLIDRYNELNQKAEGLRSGKLAQSLSAARGGDPLVFVQVNERITRLQFLILKIKLDIYNTYIAYLAFTDRIQRQPLTNYLLPGLPSMID